jgi:ABC-2 type transport system ATP-binding protein
MRQRLKLALALVHDPDIVILDEPTNGLDPRGRQEMLALIADLVRKGVRLVLSSHLLPDVEAVCDQVALLDGGRLAGAGRLLDLVGTAPRAFEVRVKGSVATFATALAARGAATRELPHGLLLVELPDPGVHAVFAAAAASGCQVRQILPARSRLEDVFAERLGGGGPRAHT